MGSEVRRYVDEKFGRKRLGAVGIAVLSLWASRANAQTSGTAVAAPPPPEEGGEEARPSPPAAPAITPPVLKKDEGAAYPEQAIKDKVRDVVTVVLVLEIDATGAVRKATVESTSSRRPRRGSSVA